MTKVFEVLTSPIFIFLFMVIVLGWLVHRETKKEVVRLSKFGLDTHELFWLSQFISTSRGHVFKIIIYICLAYYVFALRAEERNWRGFAGAFLFFIGFDYWRGRKAIAKLLNYINKLEQKQ